MRATVARRTFAGLGVALAVTLSASACGGGVDKDKLVSKLKTEDSFKNVPDKQLKCVADVVVKYGDKGKINDYVNGKKKASDTSMTSALNSKDEKKAEAAAEKCAKK